MSKVPEIFLSLGSHLTRQIRTQHLPGAQDQRRRLLAGALVRPSRRHFYEHIKLHRPQPDLYKPAEILGKLRAGIRLDKQNPQSDPMVCLNLKVLGKMPAQFNIEARASTNFGKRLIGDTTFVAKWVQAALETLNASLDQEKEFCVILDQLDAGELINQNYPETLYAELERRAEDLSLLRERAAHLFVGLLLNSEFRKEISEKLKGTFSFRDILKPEYIQFAMNTLVNLYVLTSGDWGFNEEEFKALAANGEINVSFTTSADMQILKLGVGDTKLEYTFKD